jgi:hypothetical protein
MLNAVASLVLIILYSDGKLLAPFLVDKKNFFVISSDFCHWGKRFSYTHYDRNCGAIWQSIKALDELGMRAIESQSPASFAEYQQQYSNTICGRHPIGVMLNMLASLRAAAEAQAPSKYAVQFVHYAQSSQCKHDSDSSVSYAAALVSELASEGAAAGAAAAKADSASSSSSGAGAGAGAGAASGEERKASSSAGSGAGAASALNASQRSAAPKSSSGSGKA